MCNDKQQQPTIKSVGFDDLLEDIFGLNIKGLKSIWVLFKSPAQYFAAAKLPEWKGRFAPSFRIWFSLMALSTGLRFIWAGDNSPMLGAYTAIMEQVAEGAKVGLEQRGKTVNWDDFSAKESANFLLKWMTLILPFAYILVFPLLAFIYRAWGETLSFIVRLRYVFAIIVPSSVFGFIGSLATIALPPETYQIVNFILFIGMFGLYFLTAYYGAYAHLSGGEKIGKAILIACLILIFVMIATIIAMIIALIFTIKTTFPVPI